VLPRLLKKGEEVYAFQSSALWLDIGSLSHYKRACDLAKQGIL
jgi:NDP-sugar pyrophosphorylase family protein